MAYQGRDYRLTLLTFWAVGPYKTGFGEVAYYSDVERKITLQVLLFILYIVEKDMDTKDLLLCEAAKKNGVKV